MIKSHEKVLAYLLKKDSNTKGYQPSGACLHRHEVPQPDVFGSI